MKKEKGKMKKRKKGNKGKDLMTWRWRMLPEKEKKSCTSFSVALGESPVTSTE